MFDKFKKLKQMKDLKASMEKEQAEVEKQGIKVVVNGSMKVKEVQLSSELPVEKQQKLVKQCINEAIQKVQQKVAQKVSQAQQDLE